LEPVIKQESTDTIDYVPQIPLLKQNIRSVSIDKQLSESASQHFMMKKVRYHAYNIGDITEHSKSKKQREDLVTILLGNSRDSQSILTQYKSMIRILPKEFNLSKIKQLSTHL